MKLTTKLNGSEVAIRLVRIASYGRPPVWAAEYPTWPSIDEIRFGLWPDCDFENVKREARLRLAQSERDCAVD